MNTEQRIAQLREEYKTATPARRAEILAVVEALKYPCYQCKAKRRLPDDHEHFPFCSESCHEAYSGVNYTRMTSKAQFSLPELQRRINIAKKRQHVREVNL